MSQWQMILCILALLVPLWLRLRRDFIAGLSYAVVVLVACTTLLRIETPGALPELTIQRLIFLSLVVAWFRNPTRRPIRSAMLSGWILIWAFFASISLLGAVDPIAGVKRYLESTFELFLFYFILATTLNTKSDALRILRSACLGLAIVAGLAIVEKYSGVNVVDRFVAADPEVKLLRDVRATYRHRILLGTGMAMGWPLALALIRLAPTTLHRRLGWITLSALLASCYFSMSRGPWLAAMLAGLVLAAFGSSMVRKPLAIVAALSLAVLLLMPGVRGQLFRSASDTIDSSSFKGGTFQYRLELWVVAFEGIKDSPWRFLFGNGPAAGLNQKIEWQLSYRGKDYSIFSWDNDFAYALFQYGFLGLTATLIVYGSVAWKLLAAARRTSGIHRDLFVCLCASTLALFFMMSNVHIFARQLHYLFWTISAVGFVAIRAQATTESRIARQTFSDKMLPWDHLHLPSPSQNRPV